MRKKKKCEKCGREISCSNYDKHIECCGVTKWGKRQEGVIVLDDWRRENGFYECPFCKKEYVKKGVAYHIWKSHGKGTNHNPNIGYENKTRIIWNKGETKESSESVKKQALEIKRQYDKGVFVHPMKGRTYSEEQRKRFYKNNGGYRAKGGRGKKGWYKGYWCDSSWELAWVIYQLEHNIKFERNHQGFEYEFEGIKHKYYPDFKMEDGSYTEIKGFVSDRYKAKMASFKGVLFVLGLKEIKFYIDYVSQKYGKDFVKLYKNDKPV